MKQYIASLFGNLSFHPNIHFSRHGKYVLQLHSWWQFIQKGTHPLTLSNSSQTRGSSFTEVSIMRWNQLAGSFPGLGAEDIKYVSVGA